MKKVVRINSFSSVKSNKTAVAVLLDIAHFIKRKDSQIKKDLNLNKKDEIFIPILRKNGFIRANPHERIKDINNTLTPKGFFLVNELKAENPILLKNIEPQLVPNEL